MHCTPSFLFILLFQTCRALSKALKRLLFFFIISCSLIKLSSLRSFLSALNSLQSQSRRRHQPQSQPSPSPAHRRRCRSTVLSQALKPLFFSSSQALISLRRRRRPNRRRCRRQPTPSEPTPQPVADPAHACRRRRRQPTSGQCSLLFSSEFFNFCFGLIFLDLVLFCGEKWCFPYVILGKIKKTFVLE